MSKWLNQTRENRWSIIKNFLDEGFKGINDNWWSAIRNEVHNYDEFKQMFRDKYWSEAFQNIIRDNLCNGKSTQPEVRQDVYKRQEVCGWCLASGCVEFTVP